MPGKEAAHVLQEDEAGSNVANGICDVGPDPALILGGQLLAGDADGLAGEPRNHEVSHASKSAPSDSRKVSAPNRRRLQGRVFHPLQEAGRGEGFPLNVSQNAGSDAEVGEPEFDPDVEHPDAGAKRDNADGISHTTLLSLGRARARCVSWRDPPRARRVDPNQSNG